MKAQAPVSLLTTLSPGAATPKAASQGSGQDLLLLWKQSQQNAQGDWWGDQRGQRPKADRQPVPSASISFSGGISNPESTAETLPVLPGHTRSQHLGSHSSAQTLSPRPLPSAPPTATTQTGLTYPQNIPEPEPCPHTTLVPASALAPPSNLHVARRRPDRTQSTRLEDSRAARAPAASVASASPSTPIQPGAGAVSPPAFP